MKTIYKANNTTGFPDTDTSSPLAKLLYSDNQLESVHNSIDDVIWAAEYHPFKCLYVNKASEKVLGYTSAEITSDKQLFPSLVFDEDRKHFYASVAEAYDTDKSSNVFRIKHKDGSTRIIRSQAIRQTAEDGTIMLSGIATDITYLLNTRNKLKEKAGELEIILDSINDSFFTIDHNGNITYVNKAFELMLNVRRDEVVGQSAWHMFPASLNTNFYRKFSDCLVSQSTARFQDYYEPLDKWFNVNVYPTKDGLSVYCADITEERRAQCEILKRKRNLRAIIDNTPDLIWSVDRDMTIIESNAAFRQSMKEHFNADLHEGAYALTNVPPDLAETWRNLLQRALNGEAYSIPYESHMCGNNRYSEISFNPICDEDNNIVGVSCFSRDVTNDRLQRIELERKNALLVEIAGLQSHQVRGPVASILGMTQLLDVENAGANSEIIKGIVEAAHKLDEVIKEIDIKTRC